MQGNIAAYRALCLYTGNALFLWNVFDFYKKYGTQKERHLLKESILLEYIEKIWNAHSQVIVDIAWKAALVVCVIIGTRIVTRVVCRLLHKAHCKYRRFDETLLPIFTSVATYAIYIIAALVVLDSLGANINSILAVLGAAGLAIGLALKDTLGNIAAGLMLIFLRPFCLKDFVEVNGGQLGTVKELGLFNTTFVTADGLFLVIPNALIWNNPITNFTRNGTRRMSITVGIDYNDSIQEALSILQHTVDTEKGVLQDPAPELFVTSLGDSAVNLELRVWAQNDDYWTTYRSLMRNAKENLEKAGITIPFPQRIVHHVNADAEK